MALTHPDIQVNYNASKKVAPSITEYAFGDGYSQRVKNGINHKKRTWPVVFGRSAAEIETLESFYDSHDGTTWFWWVPVPYKAADGSDLAPVKVVCKTWDAAYPNGQTATMSATFTEVSDL